MLVLVINVILPFHSGDVVSDSLFHHSGKLTSGMAANMVLGEPAAPITTNNGITKVSCIDPKKSEDSPIDGFALPKSLGSGLADGSCTGASNSVGKNR